MWRKKSHPLWTHTHTHTGKHTHTFTCQSDQIFWLTDRRLKIQRFFYHFHIGHLSMLHPNSATFCLRFPLLLSLTSTDTHKQKKVCTLIPNQTRVLLVFYLCSWLDNGDWLTERKLVKKWEAQMITFSSFHFSMFDWRGPELPVEFYARRNRWYWGFCVLFFEWTLLILKSGGHHHHHQLLLLLQLWICFDEDLKAEIFFFLYFFPICFDETLMSFWAV